VVFVQVKEKWAGKAKLKVTSAQCKDATIENYFKCILETRDFMKAS
jgi:hypothetical protein